MSQLFHLPCALDTVFFYYHVLPDYDHIKTVIRTHNTIGDAKYKYNL